jgi:alcohol dehydrogenase (cytochrome c)
VKLSPRLALACAATALAASQLAAQTRSAPPAEVLVPDFEPVTDAEIQHPDPADWLSWRRTLDSWGHSPLAQVNRENVGALRMVWARPLSPGHQEGTPLVHDGIMYFPGPSDVIEAIDAASGQMLWQYRRPLPEDIGQFLPVYDTTRNLAIYGQLILGQAADNYLYALNARTGELVWETQIDDYQTGAKISSGPIIADGLAITGRSCEPEGGAQACVIVAHDAATGREVWRRPLIAQGDDPNDASWGGLPLERRQQVGAWMIASYDPELKLIYMGTSVTAPAPKISLAGPDHDYLYHNSTLALDVRTGRIVWHYQHMVDHWDLDHTFARILVDQEVAPDPAAVAWMAPDIQPGRTYRTLTGIPGKPGIVTTLDRETGRFLWARPTVRQTVIDHIDGATGRAVLNPASVPHDYVTAHEVCPGPTGGANYMTGSYSPDTHTLFLPLLNLCAEMTAVDPATNSPGIYGMSQRIAIAEQAQGMLGSLFAVDAVTGRTRWEHRQRAGMQSLITTGGGLIFAGDAGGRFMALDQESGAELWSMNLGSSVTGYPATFAVNGRQYVAASTGRWLSDAFTPELTHGTQNTLFVFALPETGIGARGPARGFRTAGGTGFDDPALAQSFSRLASAGVFTAAQVEQGRNAYARACAACHGASFQGGPGVPPLKGSAFLGNWRGKSVAEMLSYTRTSMPVGMGGSLPDGQYLALVALMLSENGFPAGESALDADEAILGSIGID